MEAYEEVEKVVIPAFNVVSISDPVSSVHDDDDFFGPDMDINALVAAEIQALAASSSSVVEPLIAITVQSSSPPPPAAVAGSSATRSTSYLVVRMGSFTDEDDLCANWERWGSLEDLVLYLEPKAIAPAASIARLLLHLGEDGICPRLKRLGVTQRHLPFLEWLNSDKDDLESQDDDWLEDRRRKTT